MTSPNPKGDTIPSSHLKKRMADLARKTCSYHPWNSETRQWKLKIAIHKVWEFDYKIWIKRTQVFQVRITTAIIKITIIKDSRYCLRIMTNKFLDLRATTILGSLELFRSKRITIIAIMFQEATHTKTF